MSPVVAGWDGGKSGGSPNDGDDTGLGQTARTTDTVSHGLVPALPGNGVSSLGDRRQGNDARLTPRSPGVGDLSRRRRSFMEGFYKPTAAEDELPINDFNVHGLPAEWATLNQMTLKSLNDYTFHSKPGMVTRPGLEIFDSGDDSNAAYEDDDSDISFERKYNSAPSKSRRPRPVFRLLNRERPMKQSTGTMRIDRKNQLQSLYVSDFFHSVLDTNTNVLIAGILVFYITVVAVFAGLWLLVDEPCGAQFKGSYLRAFYLSMETQATVGFGAPDQYFSDCTSGAVVLSMQCCVTVLLNASIIGLLYTRLSRGGKRAETILFSDKAVIRAGSDGKPYFMFQIVEMRKHQLIEAHVRCYFFSHRGRYRFVGEYMRLNRPNDELGAPLLLAMPTLVIHSIDRYSPLMPSSRLLVSAGLTEMGMSQANVTTRSPSHHFENVMVCKAIETTIAARLVWSFRAHIVYNQVNDEINGVPPEHSHRLPPEVETDAGGAGPVEDRSQAERIYDYLSRSGYWEVVVLVEGIEGNTSSTLQARHSYTIDDLVVNATYAPCVTTGDDARMEVSTHSSGACHIDYSKINELWTSTGRVANDGGSSNISEASSSLLVREGSFSSEADDTIMDDVPCRN
ncbi:Inward rectifier potassium channel irk-1, putative [Perkinsus marinus ATCC 50983]|uniref:Inward rectifier potassium channel irk-1, putative n=2 Tax=Perkinsus marinus (strain ATCC 50983 / TXsc) TaxID=423536 RepID=C5KQ04_PERM5|nr:Inward rectifier potassium channel irk-1, putative [Perkinsus marinus ATCC 50983]EER13551.1 Inward rectifier potassium channel irk-1, putative [Perkinsus marinus ATCC 50983]|eukprot:XP_002781756.1 Inward rectifier potassium channel irk-1, putative [Perkinsus marinus ATCC 50983]